MDDYIRTHLYVCRLVVRDMCVCLVVQLLNQKEYHGTVSQAVLGADYAAVRVEGQVVLHPYRPALLPTKPTRRASERISDTLSDKTGV